LATSLWGQQRGTPESGKSTWRFPRPHVVAEYNEFIFGVDRFDQNINHLRKAIGRKNWYWPVVTWLLDTGVQNVWQLHKRSGEQ
jgi:hypothetical protein